MKDYSWRHYLPRKKARRGKRGSSGRRGSASIIDRHSISRRPEEVGKRETPGHWEADTMLFSTYSQVILVLHERYTRLLIAVRLSDKASESIVDAIRKMLKALPPMWRQTVTFDNGTEFARHYRLHELGIQTFFCDTHSPWQKGGVENAIGRLRRLLPRKSRPSTLSTLQFTSIISAYNNTPRKCLDYQTPAECFWKGVLHFKCESTPLF
jgi:transposase, IS30 family